MAKCKRCGKSGLFFRVEVSGKCKDCERLIQLEHDETEIHKRISELEIESKEISQAIEDLKQNKNAIYNEIAEQAKRDALGEIAIQIASEEERLKTAKEQVEQTTMSLDTLLSEEMKLQKSIGLAANKLKKIQTLFKAMQFSISRYQNEEVFESSILDDQSSFEVDEILETTVKLKFHLMDIRELRKAYQQNEKVIKELLVSYQSRYTTKANATIYKLMVIALESELQNVLYNLAYSKLDRSIKDIKEITSKYQKIASDGNQNIAPTIAKFIGEIEYLFIEAIKIEYEYHIQKERIKEEQRMLREQMKQEAAERKLLEEQRKKIEQEELKYKTELAQIAALMEQTIDENGIAQLREREEKIQGQLSEVEEKKEGIITLQNGKAGYIYIISNLGSFGEQTFKIGMTRRLDPQERVDELGDASVPFRFDVHSFIFSNNASDLEGALHKRLHNQRINKVNLRKEFFNCTIDELENLVYELESTASFNRTMLAEQYYQSMAIDFIPESVQLEFSDEDAVVEEEMV